MLSAGVPQGDSMSPTLFSLYINDMVDALKQNEDVIDPLHIANMKVSNGIYADDILIDEPIARWNNQTNQNSAKFLLRKRVKHKL